MLISALALALAAKDKKKEPAAQGVIAGSVFHSTGQALRGAGIVVSSTPPGGKKREWRAVADARGEFVLRVPVGPASYNVVVKFAGYRPFERTVKIGEQERVDLSIMMEPGEENK